MISTCDYHILSPLFSKYLELNFCKVIMRKPAKMLTTFCKFASFHEIRRKCADVCICRAKIRLLARGYERGGGEAHRSFARISLMRSSSSRSRRSEASCSAAQSHEFTPGLRSLQARLRTKTQAANEPLSSPETRNGKCRRFAVRFCTPQEGVRCPCIQRGEATLASDSSTSGTSTASRSKCG